MRSDPKLGWGGEVLVISVPGIKGSGMPFWLACIILRKNFGTAFHHRNAPVCVCFMVNVNNPLSVRNLDVCCFPV